MSTEDGRTFRRNRRHLRLTSEPQEPTNELPSPLIPNTTETHSSELNEEPSTPVTANELGGTPVPAEDQGDTQFAARELERPAAPASEPVSRSSPLHESRVVKYSSRGRPIRRPDYLKDYVC